LAGLVCLSSAKCERWAAHTGGELRFRRKAHFLKVEVAVRSRDRQAAIAESNKILDRARPHHGTSGRW
jgi:hypothetical protein